MVEEQPTNNIRKELTDEDLVALQTILGNVTVTRSGMLRIMAFLVQNPDLAEKTEDLVMAVEEIAGNTKKIAEELEAIRKELPRLKAIA